jgi:hypothetical protein
MLTKRPWVLGGILGAGMVLVVSASAAPIRVLWRGTGGWGDKSAYCSLYDAKNSQTVLGTIISVDRITPLPGMREGVGLHLKTATDMISVHLGPSWYVENQDIDLESNDSIQVTGSMIHCDGQDILAASKVQKGNQTLLLRDDNGHPLWAAAVPKQP